MKYTREHENANLALREKRSFTIRVKTTKYMTGSNKIDFRFYHTVLYYT